MRYVDEVIVVDDGSTDMTAEIAEKLGATVIRHNQNKGYGAALATIFREARKRNPDVLVILDADDQHDPDEIPKLIQPILNNEADIVIGSRFLGETNQPLWRRVGVKIITWLTKKAHKLPKDLTDAQSGYRAYSNKAIQYIQPQDTDMGASIDILVQAAKHKLRIKEVPIKIKHHEDANTQNPLKHATKIIIKIIETVAIQRPLLYIGIPGLILTLSGTAFTIYSIHRLESLYRLNINIIEILISIILFFSGLILSMLSAILYALARQRSENIHQ